MQQYLSIDHLIIYAFLIATLWLGIRAGRGVKDVREYVVANKSFGVGALVLTFLATNLAAGSIFNVLPDLFSEGIIMTLALFGLPIGFLIFAFFIAPKAAYFTQCMTMGDILETCYDTKSKVIGGILGFLTTISIAGMELVLLGVIGEKILNFPGTWTIIIGGLVLAMYSAHGGIKSVTITDVFQFVVFVIGLPALGYFILNKAGGIQNVFNALPDSHFKIYSHDNFKLYLTLFLLWSIFPAGLIDDPALVQRLLMSKKPQDLRNKFVVIAGFDPAFQVILCLIACSALVLFPNMEAQEVIPHIFTNLLPAGLKGIAIASLLAINISSIDSYLHISGVTLVHDVIQPLFGEKKAKINELRWMKYATVGVSFIAIAIALSTNDIFGLLLNSLAFTGPLLMFPLLSGIMGLKTDTASFYVAMVVTLAAFVGCKIFLPEDTSYLMTLITIIVNGITFFGMHLYINKGFAVVDRKKKKEEVSNRLISLTH